MAITERGRELTEAHRLLQARIGAETAVQSMAAWRLLDPTDLDGSTPGWMQTMIGAVTGQRSKSSALAASYLQAFRVAEVGSSFPPVLARPVPLRKLATSLRVTGPVSIKASLSRGVPLLEAANVAVANVAGAAMRHSLDGGRETMIRTVAADPAARGWARATSGRPCDFCAMLASRGPVYGQESVHFRSHDHCSCSGEPVFSTGAPWPAGSERYRQLWDEATFGKSGDEARKAFRAALDAPPGALGVKVTDANPRALYAKHLKGITGDDVQAAANEALAGTEGFATGEFAKDARFARQRLDGADLSEMYASQSSVDVSAVQRLAASDIDLLSLDADSPIVTAIVDGHRVIIDGHHRVLAAAERGEAVSVWHYKPAFTSKSLGVNADFHVLDAVKLARSDPGVAAEAVRRNVSVARVVELREAKTARHLLEAKAERAAAKALTADSPEVVAAAKRYGVHPDEVLTARHRVADVRAVAREEAARTQATAIAELDRLDAVKLKAPPPKSARTGTGRLARGGEYDFLEQVSERELTRIRLKWYGGTQAPDQLAANMSHALGRELSVDEAMEHWLDLNRRVDAAGALRRGKLPGQGTYSGQIDASDIIPQLSDEGYDAAALFGDELDAAAHIARVDADLLADDALRYLGDAANPVEGPRPYQMGFQAWEEEVRVLEGARATGSARYGELVPEALDEPGIDFEALYARIISTARKAGEEVPSHARIPW